MSTQLNVWKDTRIVDEFDDIINNQDNLDAVMAHIPSLFGTSFKATYLGFRALGFTPKQALQLLGQDESVIEVWQKETPEMVVFEYEKLPELQSKISADIIRLMWMRNATMFLFRDQQIIGESMAGLDEMSSRDYQYFRTIRRMYSNNEMVALEKAISPERHRDQTIVLSFGNKNYEIIDGDQGRYYETEDNDGNSNTPTD